METNYPWDSIGNYGPRANPQSIPQKPAFLSVVFAIACFAWLLLQFSSDTKLKCIIVGGIIQEVTQLLLILTTFLPSLGKNALRIIQEIVFITCVEPYTLTIAEVVRVALGSGHCKYFPHLFFMPFLLKCPTQVISTRGRLLKEGKSVAIVVKRDAMFWFLCAVSAAL